MTKPTANERPSDASLDEYLISCDEFKDSLDDIRAKRTINFISKLEKISPFVCKSHVINCEQYDQVYITSDLHADFRKLLQLLSDSRLIELPQINGKMADPYSDDVYHPDIICNTTWKGGSKVLFVIAGDIVDGCRMCKDFQKTQLNDTVGSFEFLSLCFLYNLRIQALKIKSNVLFTIGNHDLHSVLLNDAYFWDNYVDFSAKTFFGDSENRSKVLSPFYEVSPYFMLSLETTNANKEVAVVHGGFHREDDRSELLKWCTLLQQTVESQAQGLHDTIAKQSWHGILTNEKHSPLWTRLYALSPDRCKLISELKYNLVVIGHCQTHDSQNYPAFQQSGSDHHTGKIVLDCIHPTSQKPSVAFVDVAMSNCFWTEDDANVFRSVEMLKLVHYKTSGDGGWYNIEKFTQPSRQDERVNSSKEAAAKIKEARQKQEAERQAKFQRLTGNEKRLNESMDAEKIRLEEERKRDVDATFQRMKEKWTQKHDEEKLEQDATVQRLKEEIASERYRRKALESKIDTLTQKNTLLTMRLHQKNTRQLQETMRCKEALEVEYAKKPPACCCCGPSCSAQGDERVPLRARQAAQHFGRAEKCAPARSPERKLALPTQGVKWR